MTAFEFFFSFYGLLLGFSVAELVGGFARVLHERKHVRFGALTPLLAIFVAMDIATFWVQAWVIFRNAPFNFALLVLGLVVASVFYVAATLVFPRDIKASPALDDHFWQQRSLILLCVLGANVLMIGLVFAVAGPNGELQAVLGQRWYGTVFFVTLTSIAAFVRGRTPMLALLGALVLYHGYNVSLAVISLVERGGWSLLQAPAVAP
ncbi:MAG: hypothetical protein NT015_19130 [Alphaproteobacteria bacterium]|nr:hypothetical protein [Alphaproteobacteria bacterium]